METSVLTSKGQLLIPKRLRNKYGIKAGGRILFIESPKGVMLQPMDENFFNQFVGILKATAPSLKDMRAWKKQERMKEEQKLKMKGKA